MPEHQCFWSPQMCHQVPWTWGEHPRKIFYYNHSRTTGQEITFCNGFEICNCLQWISQIQITAIHFYYVFPFSPSRMWNCFYLTKQCLSGSNYLVLNWQPVIQRNLVILKAIWKSNPPSWRIPIKNQKYSFSIDTKKWKFLNWALEAFGLRGKWNSISKNKGKKYWWVLWH